TAIRRPEALPARHRCGRRGSRNASRCPRSPARAHDRVVIACWLPCSASVVPCWQSVSGLPWPEVRLRPPEIPCHGLRPARVGSRHFAQFVETIMKAVFSMALVLGVCGFAGAADKVDPVGTWNCEYEIGGQKRTCTLTVKKDVDKLVGTMNWPDQKDEKLKDVKLKESTL